MLASKNINRAVIKRSKKNTECAIKMHRNCPELENAQFSKEKSILHSLDNRDNSRDPNYKIDN